MQVVLIKKDNLYKYPFPREIISAYWIKDHDDFGNERNLVSIEQNNNSWVLISNENCKIIDNNEEVKSTTISLNKFYSLKIISKDNSTDAMIYVCNENDATYESYQLEDGEYTIGSSPSQNIIMNNNIVSEEHAILIKQNNKYIIKSKDTIHGIYVNNLKETNKALENGDIIFIMGYKIIVLNSYILINSYINGVTINNPKIIKKELPKYTGPLSPPEDDENAELYTENDYYSRAPRFVTSITEENFKIDSPPGKVEPDDTPVLYTVGPMLTMAMSSIVSASVSIINITNGNGTIISVLPTMVVSITMLVSTLLWPTLTRKYQRKKQIKREETRQKKYIEYLTEKKTKN